MQPSQDGLALAGFSKPLLGRGNSKGIPINKWIGLRLRRKATVRNRPALHPIQVQSDLKYRSFSKLRSADSAHAQTKMAKAQAALVIDIFVRKIFRWRLSNSMIANFTPDPFKHVVCCRHPAQDGVILPPPDRSGMRHRPSDAPNGGRNSARTSRRAERRRPIRMGSLERKHWNAEQRHLAGHRLPEADEMEYAFIGNLRNLK